MGTCVKCNKIDFTATKETNKICENCLTTEDIKKIKSDKKEYDKVKLKEKEEKKKNHRWLSKIENRNDAVNMVKDMSGGFIFISVMFLLIGFWIMPTITIDGIVYGVLTFIILKWHSRVASILILLMSGSTLIMTILNKIGIMHEGGSNIILAIIVFIASIRITEAIFKLNGQYKEDKI